MMGHYLLLIMKEKDFIELQKYIEEILSAHQRARWDYKAVRQTIAKRIIEKIKTFMESK